MKKVKFLVLALFVLNSWNLLAQSNYYGEAPKVKNQIIWGVSFDWMPMNIWALPLSMDSPMGKVDIKHRGKNLFSLNNSSTSDLDLGVWSVIRNPQSHVSGFFFLDYRNKGFDMKYPGEEAYKTHVTQAISPAIGMRLTLGNLLNKLKGVLEGGVAYNYNFKYTGSYNNDLKVVNNGFSGIYGLGFEFSSGRQNTIADDDNLWNNLLGGTHVQSSKDFYWLVTLQYRQDYYNFFNNHYTVGGVQPYQGFKNNFGYLSISLISWGFFLRD